MNPISLLRIIAIAIGLIYVINANADVIEPGMIAPLFTVKQLNGANFSYKNDELVVIWFFTPYCDYFGEQYSFMAEDCDSAAKRLKVAYHKHGDSLKWIGLSEHAGSTSLVSKYRSEHKIPFAVAIDNSGEVSVQFGVMYSPTVILVENGIVIYRAKAKLEALEEMIDSLLNR